MNTMNSKNTFLDDRALRLEVDKGYYPGRELGRGDLGGQRRDELRRIADDGRGGGGYDWGAAAEAAGGAAAPAPDGRRGGFHGGFRGGGGGGYRGGGGHRGGGGYRGGGRGGYRDGWQQQGGGKRQRDEPPAAGGVGARDLPVRERDLSPQDDFRDEKRARKGEGGEGEGPLHK